MLSEEKIIERVNKFINITVLYDKTYGMTCDDLKKYQQVFRGLLDLYKQEKEKNSKYIIHLTDEQYRKVIDNAQRDIEEKWKDKIRAKIKEINNRRIEDGQCELALHGFQREAKIEVLKELLERR